ncbi:uncharacterized protein gvin1l2 isoform 2-T2 [Acanthopagrus schlegelii]
MSVKIPNRLSSKKKISCPESVTESNQGQSNDTEDMTVACISLLSRYPDWSIYPGDPNNYIPIAYWRYVLTRFNERFAEEYKQEAAKIPDDWRKITEEEALNSLKVAFSVEC